jgi:hypothetical protein
LASAGGTNGFWTALFTGEGVPSLISNALEVQSTEFIALLSGIVFAGGGGILNLGYGMLLCEKKFGMGEYAQPIVGLRHSLGLQPSGAKLPRLADDAETVARWRRWLQLSRWEHGLLFLGGNVFTIVFIALTFYTLLGPGTDEKGMGFLTSATDHFGKVGGKAAKAVFTAVAFAIFFTSEIGIMDTTSRIAAGILHSTLKTGHVPASVFYHAVVWFEVVVGIVLTTADPRQPYWFLVTSAILNTVVMAIYSALVAVLNRWGLPSLAKPGLFLTAVLWGAAALYSALFLLTLGRL